MNKIYLFLLFSLMSLQCFSHSIDQVVLKQTYHYVTVFQFTNIMTGKNEGYVMREKNPSGITFYQVYNEQHQLLGTAEDGKTSKTASTANLKLYDPAGKQIGIIQGEYWTFQPAKFTIKTALFDGFANLSSDKIEFNIIDNVGESMVRLYRNVVLNEIDSWELHALRENQAPEFIIKVFAAFVSDTHDQFIKDN